MHSCTVISSRFYFSIPIEIFLSTLKVPLNFGNFYYRRILFKIAFLLFFMFYGSKKLNSKNKGHLFIAFLNFRQLLFYKYYKNSSKYPKIAVFETKIFQPSYVMPLRTNFFDQIKMREFTNRKGKFS